MCISQEVFNAFIVHIWRRNQEEDIEIFGLEEETKYDRK